MSPTDVEPEIDETRPERAAFVRYARLVSQKRTLNDQIEEVEAQLRMLEPQLLAWFGDSGQELVRVEGYTLSPHREPWVYPAEGIAKSVVCEALKASDLSHYVYEQYSTRSLTKYVRELEERFAPQLAEGTLATRDLLPEPLRAVVKIEPSYRIQALRVGELRRRR